MFTVSSLHSVSKEFKWEEIMDKWEECQELVEAYFGEKPDSPDELVKVMICMADMITDLKAGKKANQQALKS